MLRFYTNICLLYVKILRIWTNIGMLSQNVKNICKYLHNLNWYLEDCHNYWDNQSQNVVMDANIRVTSARISRFYANFGINSTKMSMIHTRECFSNWILLLNWLFSIQFSFTKSIQIAELNKLFNYPNQASISIQHYLWQIKSNIEQFK